MHRMRMWTGIWVAVVCVWILLPCMPAISRQASVSTDTPREEKRVTVDELRELQQKIREMRQKYMELYTQSRKARSTHERQQALQRMQLMHAQLQRLLNEFAVKQEIYIRQMQKHQEQQQKSSSSVSEEVIKEFRNLNKTLQRRAEEINRLAGEINQKIRRLQRLRSERARQRLSREIDAAMERLENMKKEYHRLLARFQKLMEQLAQATGIEIRERP